MRTGPHASGLVLAAVGLAGLLIALYLTATKVWGIPPVCGPLQGCETVDASSYSQVFGIPTAAFGVAYSLLVLVLGLSWWRRADRRALLAAYGLGLAGLLVEAYLVYLQLAVIRAVCAWCAAYGVTVLLGWLVAVIALRLSPDGGSGTARRAPG